MFPAYVTDPAEYSPENTPENARPEINARIILAGDFAPAQNDYSKNIQIRSRSLNSRSWSVKHSHGCSGEEVSYVFLTGHTVFLRGYSLVIEALVPELDHDLPCDSRPWRSCRIFPAGGRKIQIDRFCHLLELAAEASNITITNRFVMLQGVK